jgi:hypothetical protein
LIRLYKNTVLTKFWRKFEIKILETDIGIEIFYQLEFMGKLINLEETSMDKIGSIVVDFPEVDNYRFEKINAL